MHVVHKRSGLHRAWLLRELPEGFEVDARVSCTGLRRYLGQVLDRVRDGDTIEIRDAQGVQPGNSGIPGQVRGYLLLTPPEPVARLGGTLPCLTRTRSGRPVWLRFSPLETVAERTGAA